MRTPQATPSTVLERTRQCLLVRERPPVVPSEGRRKVFEKLRKAKDHAADKEQHGGAPPAAPPTPPKLFNKVVRIEGETKTYTYWFVLTYLPDLQWCHVAPLEARGTFGDAAGASAGRPKWMLVAEDEGGEIDVSAARCHIVEAKEMKRGEIDADKEEWDIPD